MLARITGAEGSVDLEFEASGEPLNLPTEMSPYIIAVAVIAVTIVLQYWFID